jgi:hypothetical protein
MMKYLLTNILLLEALSMASDTSDSGNCNFEAASPTKQSVLIKIGLRLHMAIAVTPEQASLNRVHHPLELWTNGFIDLHGGVHLFNADRRDAST